MKIISMSIDVTKIDKSQIIDKDKDGNPFKGGAKYFNFQVFLNSEPDKFGNHCSIAENQTKEQREAKAPKKYLGNGKVVFSNSPVAETATIISTEPQVSKGSNEDDLPF